MDKSIVVVMEESRQKSDSPFSASKSLGSLVQINSIAIDITSTVEEVESPTHEHFSIREFVAGMRKKDRKICLPFASEGSDVDNLPPLDVPRFQWWQCPNCVPDIATKRSTEETVVAVRSDVGTSSCKNVGEKKDSLLRIIMESIGNKICSGDHIADDEDNYPTKTIMYSNSCCNEGQLSTYENLDIICTGSKDKADARDKEAVNPCAMSEPNSFQTRERLNNIADPSDAVCVAVRPSCIVGDPESASSGSGATFSALPHRRKPKLRSLADIMVEEKNSTSDNPRMRSVSSGEKEAVLGPQLELDIPSDAAKVTRSPQRKRKMVLEEERGPLAKKTRSLVLHAERKCRRVENSDSESDRNAQVRLDLQLGARTERIKPKSDKALDISRKMRQTHTEDRAVSVTELPKINAACSVNAVSKGKSFGQSGDGPSTMGETGPYFRSFLSGQKIDIISNLSKGKAAEAEAEANRVPSIPTGKSILGDRNAKGKVALDLSLNSFMDAEMNSESRASYVQYRGIPDLNEEFPQKTAVMQGNQLTSHSEKRSLPLNKSLFFQDAFASRSKEATLEGKRQLGISEPQNKDNTTEFGVSDDIPMEIVELLARNQHERALGNSRRHLLPEGINNSSRGYPPLYADGFPGIINFPLASRNGLTVGNGNVGVRQNIPVNFTQLNNYQMDMRKPEESRFGFFSSSTPSQQMKTHYSASSSMMTGTRPSTGAELLWSPMRENVPFHISIPQRHSIQTNRNGVRPYSDQCHKGNKTVGDIKVGKGKKAVHDASVFKEGRIASSSTSIGSLDPYSNDTIPAMQLLSLMDQQIVSGSSFEVGPKRFLDNHHRQLNGKENHNFLGGPFFSQNSRSKDFSGLHYGVYCSGESSKTTSAYVLGQRHRELGNSKATPLGGSSNLVIRQATSSLELGACTLNRNPADFSIPDARNEFTLSAKDLKSRKRNASEGKSRSVNVEGEKRRRMRKDASGKDCSEKMTKGL